MFTDIVLFYTTSILLYPKFLQADLAAVRLNPMRIFLHKPVTRIVGIQVYMILSVGPNSNVMSYSSLEKA